LLTQNKNTKILEAYNSVTFHPACTDTIYLGPPQTTMLKKKLLPIRRGGLLSIYILL